VSVLALFVCRIINREREKEREGYLELEVKGLGPQERKKLA